MFACFDCVGRSGGLAVLKLAPACACGLGYVSPVGVL